MQVKLTNLKQIPVDGGDVYHIINSDSIGFRGFGEVYISFVKAGCKKGWKMHKEMTLNLVVPIGEVHFKFELDNGEFLEHNISPNNYQRITVRPNTWFCFQNKGNEDAMVLNFSDIHHQENEVIRRNDL